jgi:hypothetical protein
MSAATTAMTTAGAATRFTSQGYARTRITRSNCGRSSVGRASASQAEGRGFETRRPLHGGAANGWLRAAVISGRRFLLGFTGGGEGKRTSLPSDGLPVHGASGELGERVRTVQALALPMRMREHIELRRRLLVVVLRASDGGPGHLLCITRRKRQCVERMRAAPAVPMTSFGRRARIERGLQRVICTLARRLGLGA